jgi:TfoX/Sxy family transcriptional regulator of competence genes
MAWVKVPPENHPIFYDALPKSRRVETFKLFGGVAAKVNGNMFAGLFGRSTIVLLSETDRAAALALEGAAPFDPMGNGRVQSDKVMLPESMMADEEELRSWIARAFETAAALPAKLPKGPMKPPKKVVAGAKKQAGPSIKVKRSPRQKRPS